MASLIESEAVFSGRLKACGLEAYAAEFHRRGWRTLSTFAFSSSWAPGSGDDQSFYRLCGETIAEGSWTC